MSTRMLTVVAVLAGMAMLAAASMTAWAQGIQPIGDTDITLPQPVPIPAKPDPDAPRKMKEAFEKATLLMTAKVTIKVVGQTNSMPPHMITETTLTEVKMLRGKEPKNLTIGTPAGVKSGDTAVIAAEEKNGVLNVLWAGPADDDTLKAANASAGAASKPTSNPTTAPANGKTAEVAGVTIPDVEAFNKLMVAPILVTGKVKGMKMGPMGLSDPPLYSISFGLDEAKAIRGDLPKDAAGSFTLSTHSLPALKNGDVVVVGAELYEKRLMTKSFAPADAEMKKALDLARQLPLGWQVKDGKLVSPWDKWPADALNLKTDAIKDANGRPALLCGEGITMTVEKVIPKDVQQYVNPYGDGEFTITVTNTGKMYTAVQGLLTDGKEIAWPASLVIIDSQGVPHTLPHEGQWKGLITVTLKAGEKVSTTVNTLKLKGMNWPNGGSRVLFTFGLGELGQTDFFYYSSKRHDAMRK